MKCVLPLLLVGLTSFEARAASLPETSLFFSADEVQTIEQPILKSLAASSAGQDVQLGAVFYYAPNDWVLWLQNQRWTPQTRQEGLRILEVAPDRVRLVLVDDNKEITLRPHQTYLVASGRIVEGDGAPMPSVSR